MFEYAIIFHKKLVKCFAKLYYKFFTFVKIIYENLHSDQVRHLGYATVYRDGNA